MGKWKREKEVRRGKKKGEKEEIKKETRRVLKKSNSRSTKLNTLKFGNLYFKDGYIKSLTWVQMFCQYFL